MACALLATATANAQWNSNGNDIYYTNGNVGIGTSTPEAYTQLHITAPELNYSSETGVRVDLSVDGPTSEGKVISRLGIARSWHVDGDLYGVSGYVDSLSRLRTSYTDRVLEGLGGTFTVSALNLTVSKVAGSKAYVGGSRSLLQGTISSFPTDITEAVAAAVIAEDKIQAPYTYAGYFDGRSYFTGDMGIGTHEPEARLHVSGGDLRMDNGRFLTVTRSDDGSAHQVLRYGWQ